MVKKLTALKKKKKRRTDNTVTDRRAYIGRILREVVEVNSHTKTRTSDGAKAAMYRQTVRDAEILITRAVCAMKARSTKCITSTIGDLEIALRDRDSVLHRHTIVIPRAKAVHKQRKVTIE